MDARYQSGSQPGGNAGEEVKEGINQIAESGREAANKLQAALVNAKQKIEEKTTASAKATDRAIREHPYESIGVAFGIGVLIGVLINRK